MVRIKICGIANLDDARAAIAAGADMLGFNFYRPSPRFITPQDARTIIESLRAEIKALPRTVTMVGVFVNEPAESIVRITEEAGVAAIQLHGDESPSYVPAMTRPVIKAIAWGPASEVDGVAAWPLRVTLLLDAHDPVGRGGTGRTIDWASASTVAAARRVVLAGGLTPENVGEAIERVKPFGIDVSSGVETSPGIKDHGRLKALFEAVARAFETPNGPREEEAPAARARRRREARRSRAAERERAGVGSPRASRKG